MMRTRAAFVAAAAILMTGCAGGMPLLHSARALPTGDVRAAVGVSANVAGGGLDGDLRRAKSIAAQDPTQMGTPGMSPATPAYAKGALVAAAISPGVAPFVSARVGIGNRFEGGLSYTGRAVRLDARRSFDFGHVSLSAGLGGTAALYGRQSGTELPGVDLGSLHGWGADLPVLVGWQSTGALYQVWGGLRGGFEHDTIELVTSEPLPFTSPTGLSATRYFAGGVAGIAAGLHHVHVALEVSAAYEYVDGAYNTTAVTTQGFSVTPGSALWFTF
jgi:hypothetical protein